MSLLIVGFVAQYIICASLCYAMFFGKEYKDYRDIYSPSDRGRNMVLGMLYGVLSILGVFVAFLVTGFADGGLKW